MDDRRRGILLISSALLLVLAMISAELAAVSFEEVGGTAAGAWGLALSQLAVAYALIASTLVLRTLGHFLWLSADRLHPISTVIAFSTILPLTIFLELSPAAAALVAFAIGLVPTIFYLVMTRPDAQPAVPSED